MKKLSPERRAELLAEMRLADLLTEKRWAERYGVSARTLRRLRAEALERPIARSGENYHILFFASPPVWPK